MPRLFLLILLCSPLLAVSQNFIGKKKTQVKKELEKQIAANDSLTITLNDNDSTIIFSFKDDKVRPVDFIYGFNKSGKCWSEKVMAGCDACYKKYLTALLAQKKYAWKQLNQNQYISRYADHLLIELPGNEKNYSYTILRTDWTRDQYKMLTASEN